MRAEKRLPLFRIALLSLAVLFAHTARATNARPIPVSPPCARKVAAAQLDPQKKLIPAIKLIANPGERMHGHSFFGASFAGAPARGVFFAHRTGPLAVARPAVYVLPQRLPFALRI